MEFKKLGELCSIVSGGTPSRSKVEFWNQGTIPWIKIGNLKGKYVNEADEFITQEGLNGSSAKLLPKGTVLYTIFATLGEVGILEIEACTNQAIAGLSINDSKQLTTDYLYYFLKSKKTYVNDIGRGVAQNNINMSILRNFDIPVPNLIKQKEIVSILDKVSFILNKRSKELQLLDELVKARFVEMFGGCTNRIFINDICSIITDGTHQSPKFHNTGIPFILVSNLSNNVITYNTEKFINEETYNELIKRTPIEIGDVLLSTVGSYGHPAIVTKNKKFLFQRHIAYMKPKHDLVNSVYLHSALLSSDIQQQIEDKVKGIAQKTLNLSEIRKIVLPLPSIDEQNQFADFVQQVDKSKSAIKKSLEETQILFDSLMQKYFG